MGKGKWNSAARTGSLMGGIWTTADLISTVAASLTIGWISAMSKADSTTTTIEKRLHFGLLKVHDQLNVCQSSSLMNILQLLPGGIIQGLATWLDVPCVTCLAGSENPALEIYLICHTYIIHLDHTDYTYIHTYIHTYMPLLGDFISVRNLVSSTRSNRDEFR